MMSLAELGQLEILKELLQLHPYADLSTANKLNETILHWTIRFLDNIVGLDIVQYLIDNIVGLDINTCDAVSTSISNCSCG